MRLKIESQEDFWAGVMFIAFGVVAIFVARDYPMGSTMRMGPGYFPTYVGAILAMIGAIIALRALKVPGPRIGVWGWRPLVMLGLGFVAYGLLMETFETGFVLALAVLIVLSSLGGREFRPVELAILTVVLVGGAVGIFIYGLELPYPLFWWR